MKWTQKHSTTVLSLKFSHQYIARYVRCRYLTPQGQLGKLGEKFMLVERLVRVTPPSHSNTTLSIPITTQIHNTQYQHSRVHLTSEHRCLVFTLFDKGSHLHIERHNFKVNEQMITWYLHAFSLQQQFQQQSLFYHLSCCWLKEFPLGQALSHLLNEFQIRVNKHAGQVSGKFPKPSISQERTRKKWV